MIGLIGKLVLTCLFTALGSECVIDAPPPIYATCLTTTDNMVVCVADVTDVPLYASWYSHELCDIAPINGDGDCSWKAGRKSDTAHYGEAAACPMDWLWLTITTPYGEYLCDDRGGAIKLGYRDIWTPERGLYQDWAWTIDFFLDPHQELPWWVYLPIQEWSINE